MESADGDGFTLRSDLLDEANDLFLAIEVETATIVDVNQTVCAATGYSREELLGMDITELADFPDPQTWREGLPAAEESLPLSENVLTRADGEELVVEGSVSRTTRQDGDYVVALLRDISARRAERRELSRYRAFVEHSSDVIAVAGSDGTIQYVSSAAQDIYGDNPKELQGTNALERVHPADKDRVEAAIAELVSNPAAIVTEEYRFRHADGSWLWVETTGTNRLDDDEIEGLVLVTRDISGRKEREQELRAVTNEYEALFENADDAIFLVDVDETEAATEFRYERLNPYHEQATGLQTAAVRGRTPTDALGEDLGSEVEANYRRCVRQREPISYEETLELPTGEVVWETSLAPVIVDDEVTRIVGISRDVTERTEYEDRLERQRDDLTVLNQVLRHDIRNDLQIVQVYAETLSNECAQDHADDIQRILESAEHAVDLTTTAREMADVMLTPAEDQHRVQLHTTLERELDRIRGAHPNALITTDGAIPQTPVVADDMLNSVFRNLLKNAIQHNDRAVPEIHVSATAGEDRVVVRVADNGPGIDHYQREAIWGKGEKGLESAGAGIGLYLVRTLVESYGGEVRLAEGDTDSHDDADGATFVVELPVAE